MALSWLTRSGKESSVPDIFQGIYDRSEWVFGSGEGSLPSSVGPYRSFVQEFLHRNSIRSVVDAGCGDWQFSQLIDWSGIDYLGIDTVKSVISENVRRFERPEVRFMTSDLLNEPPPGGDLLLLKDVLQHWPNASIQKFLPAFARYRFVLITNEEALGENVDIPMGSYRPLDVRKQPFNVEAVEVCRFGGISRIHHGMPWTKITLLYQPSPQA